MEEKVKKICSFKTEKFYGVLKKIELRELVRGIFERNNSRLIKSQVIFKIC